LATLSSAAPSWLRSSLGLLQRSALLSALCLFAGAASAAPRGNCHIHAPAEAASGQTPTVEAVPATIGPFDGVGACERARRGLFGELGRCHCSAGFTPGWVGRETGFGAGSRVGGGIGSESAGGVALP
jgi:hypothetical protein